MCGRDRPFWEHSVLNYGHVTIFGTFLLAINVRNGVYDGQ